MTLLDQLLLLSGLTAVVATLVGRLRFGGWIVTGLYALQLLWLVGMGSLAYGGPEIGSGLQFTVLGETLTWRYDAVSWFFALITVGAGLASSAFMSGDWGRWYRAQGHSLWLLHLTLTLNVFAMLLLLGSGDLLSLFIGWELVSWAGFLLMAQAGGPATRAAVRYIVYAMAGAMAIMAGMALVYAHTGSLDYAAVAASTATLSKGQVWALVLLFGAGFGVKMALLPFHLWQAAAYAETPGPGAAFLGAISSRMGLFGIVVVLIQLLGITRASGLAIAPTFVDPAEMLAWVAAFTMIVPTYIALRQNDARMLLAWHGIGQGGYMLLGLVIGDSLGSAGGLLHAFNYATYQAALFLSVTAVVYRTGTADLNRLGGLVTRMPLSFLVMLIGIIGLAGIPPMNGFVSKWMIYRSLLLEGRPILFLASVIATLGTILSVYKLIHNTFLGQLRKEHGEVREAPWSMTVPMLALCVIVFVTGVFPGLIIEWVAAAQQAIGLPPQASILGGIEHPRGGLDMIWLTVILFAGFGVGALLFYSGGRAKQVHPLDNYAGGHFLTADTRYQYSADFYSGLMKLIGGWYRGSFEWAERALLSLTDVLSRGTTELFRAARPAFLLLATAAIALWVIL